MKDFKAYPAIRISGQMEPELLRELEAGLEEEGVPWQCELGVFGKPEQLAYDNAQLSILGVGIGGNQATACLYQRQMPEKEPLFQIHGMNLLEWRRLGINAARLVKGKPFELESHER